MNILLALHNQNYVEELIEIVRKVFKEEDKKILYISISRPCKTLEMDLFREELEKDRVIIIDAITKKVVKNPKERNNCKYISSPTAIDELYSVVDEIAKKEKFSIAIVDSISSLASYMEEKEAVQAVFELASKISLTLNCEGIFLCSTSDMKSEVISKTAGAFEKVIDSPDKMGAKDEKVSETDLAEAGLIKQ